MRKFWLKILVDLAYTFTVFTLVFTLAGYGGGSHWVLDLFSHFRAQYLAGGLLLTFIFLLLRRWRWSAVTLICVGINLAAVLPWYGRRHQGSSADAQGKNLRVVLSNVFTGNVHKQKVLAFVRKEVPDILILQEIDAAWRQALRELDAEMGHSRVFPQEDNFGIGIWSRLPLRDAEIFGVGASDIPVIRAKVEVAGTIVEIIAVHPLPPVSSAAYQERNSHLATITEFVRKATDPVIVLGDLNVSVWSPVYSNFIRKSALVNTRQGFGVLPTWPTINPLVMIPLDHCLVSSSIGVAEMRTGPDVGSDHLPIIVDLHIPTAAP